MAAVASIERNIFGFAKRSAPAKPVLRDLLVYRCCSFDNSPWTNYTNMRRFNNNRIDRTHAIGESTAAPDVSRLLLRTGV